MTRAKAKIQSSLRPGLLGRNLQGKPWSSLSESSSSVPNYEPPRCCTHSSTLPGTSQDGPNLTPNSFLGKKRQNLPPVRYLQPSGHPGRKGDERMFRGVSACLRPGVRRWAGCQRLQLLYIPAVMPRAWLSGSGMCEPQVVKGPVLNGQPQPQSRDSCPAHVMPGLPAASCFHVSPFL